MNDDSQAAVALTIIYGALVPIATSGAMGSARVCTALAEKGLLTEADVIAISFDALKPFDKAIADIQLKFPPVAKSLEQLRQHLEQEWDKAIAAAYRAKKGGPIDYPID